MRSPAEPKQLWTWNKFAQTFPTEAVKGSFQHFAAALGQIFFPCNFRSRIIKEQTILHFATENTFFPSPFLSYCNSYK